MNRYNINSFVINQQINYPVLPNQYLAQLRHVVFGYRLTYLGIFI